MRGRSFLAWILGAALVACASAPAAPAPTPTADDHDTTGDDDDDGGADDPLPDAAAARYEPPERTRPPSTATYEQAMSTPESMNVNDTRLHLTDLQLQNPMRSVTNGCRVPPSTRITVKAAVRDGRAIGVTVRARVERPKAARPPAGRAAKAEAKRLAKITACVDKAVRLTVWPPSQRRDSLTMEF